MYLEQEHCFASGIGACRMTVDEAVVAGVAYELVFPQMVALNNFMAELVNFGIPCITVVLTFIFFSRTVSWRILYSGLWLAQKIMTYLKDVRPSKSSFQLSAVLGIVKQPAATTVVKDMKPGASLWDAIGNVITHLIEESTNWFVQPISEPENVIKSKYIVSCS